MAEVRENPLYIEDIEYVVHLHLPWEKLDQASVFIAGATGLIGTFLVDVLMHKNLTRDSFIKVYAMGRNTERAAERFNKYWDDERFVFVQGDVNKEIEGINDRFDYVIHAASNTHPMQYSTDPIGTILTNIEGTKNVLEFARRSEAKRTVFVSSVEVYGENRGDTEYFDEAYCGYIDCNTLRAGYPEGKRSGEALCQAYRKQYGMDIVIPRLSRTYGPTMLQSDSKAIAQFIKKGIAGEDIVLKSEGTQLYSYSYVADAVAGLLYVLLCGKDGEAYNIADQESDITLKDLASIVANMSGKEVVFELPDETERRGYSKATKAILDSSKLQELGWKAHYDMLSGLERTIEIGRAG